MSCVNLHLNCWWIMHLLIAKYYLYFVGDQSLNIFNHQHFFSFVDSENPFFCPGSCTAQGTTSTCICLCLLSSKLWQFSSKMWFCTMWGRPTTARGRWVLCPHTYTNISMFSCYCMTVPEAITHLDIDFSWC